MSEQVAFFRLDEVAVEPVVAPVAIAAAGANRGQGSQAAAKRGAGVDTVAPRRSVAAASGGPVRRMQNQLATAFKEETDWKEF